MQIWLETNIEAHHFIAKTYWTDHFELVMHSLPDAEVYIYEDGSTGELLGFTGLIDDFVAGLFVKKAAQSRGIGKLLLDSVKTMKTDLQLRVYQKNTRAIAFYQRERFVVTEETTDETTNEKEFVLVWQRETNPSLRQSEKE